MDDPINFSLVSGAIMFVASTIAMYALKPSSVMKVDRHNRSVIDRMRLFIVSILIGSATSICVFLYMYKGSVIEAVKMNFLPNSISY